MVLLLTQLACEGKIEKTGAKPKLPVQMSGANSENLDVYKIPLNLLFYNDKNGRIATGMPQLAQELEPVPDIVNTQYNDSIANLIKQDNNQALKRTQKSIANGGQQVFGYVLNNGRIIDGNRRFTALRNLQKDTGKTYYFEAVILPFSYSEKVDRLKIKQLELAIQMGVEKRQDYDPVDLALDIYQTTQGPNAIMSLADYVSSSHL